MPYIPSYHTQWPQNRTQEQHTVKTKNPTNYPDLTLFRPNDIRRSYTFAEDTMHTLSASDRLLFQRFGYGPITTVPYTAIHHAFETQVLANPQAIAAQHLDDTITYAELDRQANRLAALLAHHGVSNGDNVALFLQRSIPMLVGIIATLKLGAAYAPQHVGVGPEAHSSDGCIMHCGQLKMHRRACVPLSKNALQHLQASNMLTKRDRTVE